MEESDRRGVSAHQPKEEHQGGDSFSKMRSISKYINLTIAEDEKLQSLWLECLKFWREPLKRHWMDPGRFFGWIDVEDSEDAELSYIFFPEVRFLAFMTLPTPVYVEGRYKTWRIFIISLHGRVTRYKIERFFEDFEKKILKTLNEVGGYKFESRQFVNTETFIFVGDGVKTNPRIPSKVGRYSRIFALNNENMVPKICRILSKAIMDVFNPLKEGIERSNGYMDEYQEEMFDAYHRFLIELEKISAKYLVQYNANTISQDKDFERVRDILNAQPVLR